MAGTMESTLQSGLDHHAPESQRSELEMAAILLLGLGEGPAANVLKKMSSSEVIRLTRAMTQVQGITLQELEYVSGKVLQESEQLPLITDRDYVQRTLRTVVGDKKAGSLMQSMMSDELSPILERLVWLEPDVLAEAIKHEHPQLQAVILTCMEPDRSADVLSRLPQQQQMDVVSRLGSLDKVPAASIDAICALLESIDDQGSRPHTIDGTGQLAEILNHVEDSTSEYLMEHLREHNEAVAEQVASLRFTFKHLLMLDEKSLRLIIEKTSQEALALALKGLPETEVQKVLGCMTQRGAGYVRDEMETSGQVRMSRVLQSRREMINTARALEMEGLIEVSLASEELVN